MKYNEYKTTCKKGILYFLSIYLHRVFPQHNYGNTLTIFEEQFHFSNILIWQYDKIPILTHPFHQLVFNKLCPGLI